MNVRMYMYYVCSRCKANPMSKLQEPPNLVVLQHPLNPLCMWSCVAIANNYARTRLTKRHGYSFLNNMLAVFEFMHEISVH